MTSITGLSSLNSLTPAEAARWYLDHGLRPIPWFAGDDKKIVGVNGFTYQDYLGLPQDNIEWLIDNWRPEWQVGLAFTKPPEGQERDAVYGVDIDAIEDLQNFEQAHGPLPREQDTWVQSTGRGMHILLKRGQLLDLWPYHGKFSQLYPGLEIKSNGFIAVSPSIHPSGVRYQWHDDCPEEILATPYGLAQYLMQRETERPHVSLVSRSNGNGSGTTLDLSSLTEYGIPEGLGQDDTLAELVWVLVQRGLPDSAIKILWEKVVENTKLTKPGQPFTDHDVMRHLKGAREKLGSGLQQAQFAWVNAQSNFDDIPREEDPAIIDSQVKIMLKLRPDGSVDLQDTKDELPRSDQASSDFIKALWHGWYRFGTQSRMWRLWNGVCFVKAEDAHMGNIIKNYARAHREVLRILERHTIRDAIATGQEPDEARETYERKWKKHRSYRDALWNHTCKVRILKELETSWSVSEANFDADLNVAPCENGVLHWGVETVGFTDHDRQRLVTKRLAPGVYFDPSADAPQFRHFLETSIPDVAQREWLQKAMGAALFGRPWKGFLNLIGKTNSGKSTFARVMHKLFGSYSSAVSVETFLLGAGNRDFQVHELKGVRLAIAGEPAPGRRLDSEIIKALTGGDPQRTRGPYDKYVEWNPCVTIMISSNQPMKLETSDEAMVNRIGPVLFSNKHEIDEELEQKLEQETSGILNWLIEGTRKIMSEGHGEVPRSMIELREYMADEIDDALRFFSEKITSGEYIIDRDAHPYICLETRSSYSDYIMWASLEGIRRPVGAKQFTQRISRRYPTIRSNGTRFAGITRPKS